LQKLGNAPTMEETGDLKDREKYQEHCKPGLKTVDKRTGEKRPLHWKRTRFSILVIGGPVKLGLTRTTEEVV